MLNWVQAVSRRCVFDAVQNENEGSQEEKFLTVLGWLVAANLNLEAARLAIAEGEVDLGQLLMCRHRPELMARLMKSYLQSHPRRLRHTMHPRLCAILDLLCGESETLLNELKVDWRIRLGMSLSYGFLGFPFRSDKGW